MSKQEKKVTNTLKEGENNALVIGRRFAVQFDINYAGSPGETPTGESMAVPDMNLTVRQLLENHTRGKDGKVRVNQPLYFDTVIPQIHDITDVEAYKEHLESQLASTKEFIKQEQDAKAKAEADAKAKEKELSPSNASKKAEEKTEE